MTHKEEEFQQEIADSRIPVLTLDNKWYRLFRNLKDYPKIIQKEKELNELLKRQGKINTEIREIKVLKKKLMEEIVNLADEMNDGATGKKLEDNRRIIEECNSKMDAYQEEMNAIPMEIEEKNKELMLETCLYCYENLHQNNTDIMEIEKWVDEIKEELKKRIIQKQSMEIQNRQIYAYMSDIFGDRIHQMFDIKEQE